MQILLTITQPFWRINDEHIQHVCDGEKRMLGTSQRGHIQNADTEKRGHNLQIGSALAKHFTLRFHGRRLPQRGHKKSKNDNNDANDNNMRYRQITFKCASGIENMS